MADRSLDLSLLITAKDLASSKVKGLNGWLAKNKAQLMGVALAGVAMGVAVFAGAIKAADAAGVQQKAEALLAAAMKQKGIYTDDALKKNIEYAGTLQKMTTFGDESILGVQRMLTTFGAQGEMLDKLTMATLDLAVAQGMDLKSAGDLVAKSIGTSANAMSRYGVTIEGGVGSTERMNSAVDNITKLFGGTAKAEAETYAGKVKQLSNRWGDIVEKIGMFVIPIFMKLIKLFEGTLLPTLENTTVEMDTIDKSANSIVGTLKYLIKTAYGIVFAFENIGNAIALVGAIASRFLLLQFTEAVQVAEMGIQEFEERIIEQGKTLKEISKVDVEVVKQRNEAIVTSNKERIDIMLMDEEESNAQMISYAMANAEARKLTETTLQAEMKAIREKMKNDWIDAWAVMMLESKTKSKTFYDYYVDLINGMTSAMRTGFADVIGHIGEGWDNLKGYAQKMAEGIRDSFINMLADMATNWIKEHILMSNATKVWKFLEVSASAAVGAAKAAAATAWTLFGAIAIGAAVGAAILAFGNQFAQGGIVGGSSFGGDNVMARVNSGEMILNASQQARLFEMANGRRSGGGINVVIEFTGNNFVGSAGVEEVAELVSREIYNKVKNEVML